ncbi:RNA-directed DNA polymerase [Adlercreutzia muris]|uniref:RNA-directed DNA polymerase n=1 Tax=Adlercreutzia muris TaxID=1796610 RepID=UPI00351433BF
MNSEERRAARRKRREEKRARKKRERCKNSTLDTVADLNALYKAQREAARGVAWKSSTQRYQIHWLINIIKAKRDLLEGNEVCKGFHEFDIFERGKRRHISSVHFSERVIQKSFTQNALMPSVRPTLIYDNAANIKDKGTAFAVKRTKKLLADHYRKHGSDGYVLQADFSDFFASIPHEPVNKLIDTISEDGRLTALGRHFIEMQGDVGLGLGSEPNQICAIAFPSPLDHLICECCGVEGYIRYMDDFICVHTDKQALQCILAVVRDKCAALGLTLNEKKTHITKFTKGFTFLKKRFTYSETGKVVVRPCRESITRERRKLKKQAALVAQGKMTFAQWVQSYQSWRGSIMGLDSRKTLAAMDELFARLSAWAEMQGDPPPGMIFQTLFSQTPRFEGFFIAQNTGFLR